MKIVINISRGGFGLSTQSIKRMILEGGKGIIVKSIEEYTRIERFYGEPLTDIDGYYETNMLGGNKLCKDGKVYEYKDTRDDNRIDPILVRIVEEMESSANGRQAKLKVVEVPDDVQWEIIGFFGFEAVVEKHRRWF